MDSDGSSTVVLTVAAAPWRNVDGDLEALAERIVNATLEAAASVAWLTAGEVSLLLTDDAEIRSLNAAYREKDKATNVLSFPSLELDAGEPAGERPPGAVLLGDVVISHERVAAEALAEGKGFIDHFAHLLAHGTLHLLGYDHESDGEAVVMEGLETKILDSLGFAVPYQQPAVVESSASPLGTAP